MSKIIINELENTLSYYINNEEIIYLIFESYKRLPNDGIILYNKNEMIGTIQVDPELDDVIILI